MKTDQGIAIIDYKMSNLFSIKNALDNLGIEAFITSDSEEILNSKGAILPGVGSYPEAMGNLYDMNLISTIKDFVDLNKPFMGICLGLQLLFEKSEEFGNSKGLGIINGSVKLFSDLKEIRTVPHVGWNQALLNEGCNSANHSKIIEDKDYFYFVHSLYVSPEDEEIIKSYTYHDGFKFCSSIMYKNIFASQFHPEKSGPAGLHLLSKFFGNV
jgi:glutamine amidotransferase